MLGKMKNGVYVPVSENGPENRLQCPACGKVLLTGGCDCTAYTGVKIDSDHILKIEEIIQILRASGYHPAKFGLQGKHKFHYSDIMVKHDTPGFQNSITLINEEPPIEELRKRTFALSMVKMFVGYIVDYDAIDVSKSEAVDFIVEHYGYVTVYSKRRLYNYYPKTDTFIPLNHVNLRTVTSDKMKNQTYYKVCKLEPKEDVK
ncbi:hypothetical protein HNP86_001900 [Methanococcus maripaludis]|uniref:Uncharacterized protein n=1 Tax=Methanococcus maripaludis TaxID=39152 RepID=A0A7J9NWR0_METMI|nr:hypothetical protein [Methanococcus maripaludis]MBA2851741.1 hypothetical protein [Methanococcus maripaludis]